MKKCSTCKLEKDDVSKAGKCRQCNTEYCRQFRAKNRDKVKKYQKEYGAKYYQENKEEILTDKKEYYQENKEIISEERKDYYQEHKEEKQTYNKKYYLDNREELIEDAKLYASENPEWLKNYHNEYYKERRLSDPNFRIRTAISANINYYLKSNNSSKAGASCLNYLPFTVDELRKHLENQFDQWMNWDNYGRYEASTWNDSDMSTWTWQIDHIVPQSTLPYVSMEEENFKKCWSLENLRPLNSKQNFLDGVNRVRHT